jgi:hypothetical protein
MHIRSLRCLPVLLVLALTAPLHAQEEIPGVLGVIDEAANTYTAPGGHFRISIPVLPELGGAIEDSLIVSDFRDDYGTHILVAHLPLTDAMRAELQKKDRKDFFTWFYGQQILPEYETAYPGAKIESARYFKSIGDGCLYVAINIPSGSAFRGLIFLKEGETEPAAKRGSFLFLRNDRIFIVTTELYERVLKRDTFRKTPEEEDAILSDRLRAIVDKMSFPNPAAKPSAPAAPASATTPGK